MLFQETIRKDDNLEWTREFTNMHNSHVLRWNKKAPWDTAIAMNDSVVKQAAHIEGSYHDHWMTLDYTTGRDLWAIAAVHMFTSWQSAEKFKDALNDLDNNMDSIAAEKKKQPRVLVGGLERSMAGAERRSRGLLEQPGRRPERHDRPVLHEVEHRRPRG